MKVVATFSILGDLVREVGGDTVEVTTMVGPDSDAHTYQPKPTDARALAGAKVLVSNGLGFEGWIDRLAEASGFKGRPIVASAGAPAESDPHCWQDVACTRRYVSNIADGLASADPANAVSYRARAVAYDQKLAALDAWIRGEIANVPAAQRQAITGHTSFRYFARAYDVRFAAPTGYSTDAEPTARDVANLIRQVREQKIKAVFVENMTNPALVAEIARDSGANVGPRLYSDALSKPGGPASTYEAMMRHNVTALVAGMQKN
jgi:zinc/manganese transport system substrate-binding protein